MIKTHRTKIALLFCIVGMIMAPDNIALAVMMLCTIAVMLHAGREHINEAVGDWWKSRK